MPKDLTPAQLKELYWPPDGEFVLIDVPEMRFFMVDGEGSPDDPPFRAALQWLFAAVEPIKVEARQRMGSRFVEPPLEGLFWADDMAELAAGQKDRLKWRLMIPAPGWATDEMLAEAVVRVAGQHGPAPEGLRLDTYDEGRSAQILFVGPSTQEQATLDRLHREFLPAQGLVARGPHHEIYLSEPEHTPPEQLKTVLRQPVQPAEASCEPPPEPAPD